MILIVLASTYFVIMLVVITGVIIGAGIAKMSGNKQKRGEVLEKFRAASFQNEDELSWYIAHDVMGSAGFPDCVVYKVDHTEKVCRQIAAFGPKNPDKMSILNPINIPFSRGIVGHVAMSGKMERIDDTTKDPRYVPDDDVRYSELTMPVLVNGVTVLVIDSEHKKSGWFKEAEVEFVKQVAVITEEKLRK